MPEIPDLPAGNVPVLPSGGLDPVVTVGTATSAPGKTAILPVSINSAGGLKAADFTASYNTTLLDLANADVVLGSLPVGWSLVRNVVDASGLARIGLHNSDRLASASGALVNLTFHIVSNASSSTVPVSLATNTPTASRLNEGQLPVTPVAGAVVIDATRVKVKQVRFSTAQQPAGAKATARLPAYTLSGITPLTSTLPLTGCNQIQVVFDKCHRCRVGRGQSWPDELRHDRQDHKHYDQGYRWRQRHR
ncbi:MAG: cohesin domain-containing protein [Tepidisphaerales bacterium]